MFRIDKKLALSAALAVGLTGCVHNNAKNPIASVNSRQPDKILFDRAMDAMKHSRFDEARLDLQTLINTYPDSEYIARAKLAIGDAWYQEGGTAAWQQAEAEYKDFITFFPNLPEAAEAQLKVANIHYRQMEKPDRDYTEAARAEDEYRSLIQQFPDSKLVPEAKQRLREVQEVLAAREFLIGRFYYLRDSWSPAIARLKSVADTYPLYSGADEALFMMGQCYEGIAHDIVTPLKGPQAVQFSKLSEDQKKRIEANRERLQGQAFDAAAQAYSRLIERYPVGARADAAKERLASLHKPIPTPTPEAIARNQAELDSREQSSMVSQFLGNFRRAPDTALTAKIGEPTLTDPSQANASEISKQILAAGVTPPDQGSAKVGIETLNTGRPSTATDSASLLAGTGNPSAAPAAEPAGPAKLEDVPEAGAAPGAASAGTAKIPDSTSAGTSASGATSVEVTPGSGKAASPTIAGLETPKPDPATLPADPPATAPDQINEIAQAGAPSSAAAADSDSGRKKLKVKESTSKKKKKRKLLLF